VRVVIAEDNVLLSTGLEMLLNRAGFHIVAIADDAAGFLTAVRDHRPDVTIVDVRLPPSFRDEGSEPPCRPVESIPACPSWCCRSTSSSSTPPNCSPPPAVASATC
jgi:hypothetical protein